MEDDTLMAYSLQGPFQNDGPPPVSAGVLNAMDAAIADLDQRTGPGGSGHGHVIDPGLNALPAAIEAGHTLIYCNPGDYPTDGIVELSGRRSLRIIGGGQNTRIRCTKTGTPLEAAFRLVGTGTDGIGLQGLVIDCDGKADVGIKMQPTGNAGSYQDEPDAVHRLSDLWVYDANYAGIQALTNDGTINGTSYIRSSHLDRIRVRRAGYRGFDWQAADCWLRDCEATTSVTDHANGAGLWMWGANNFVEGFKAWYTRSAGFRIRGTRNNFVNCHSQDTAHHGFWVEYDKNALVGCWADTASMHDVGGTVAGADGFYVATGITRTTVQGCWAFDRRPAGAGQSYQRYGINAPATMFAPDADGMVLIAGFVGWDNATALVNQR